MAETNKMQWTVLINDEEQYGLFPLGLVVPSGWRTAGFSGTEEACIEYVDQHWTDMRPASLRRAMDGDRRPT
jgi:MbtH protein